MTTHHATITSSRVAAGVTAAFVLALSRASARAAGDDRRAARRRPAGAAPRFVRARADCGRRDRGPVAA